LVLTKRKNGRGIFPRHWNDDYRMVEDRQEGNKRIITLEKIDNTEIKGKVKECVNEIMKRLGETSKVLRGVLEDTINEYWDEAVLNLHDKLFSEKNVPVTHWEGCRKAGRTPL